MRIADKPIQREIFHTALVLADRVIDIYANKPTQLAQIYVFVVSQETARQVSQVAEASRQRRKRARNVRLVRQRLLSLGRRVHNGHTQTQLELSHRVRDRVCSVVKVHARL